MSDRGSLDGFLDYSSRAPKTGGYLGGWKKSKDEEHGEITVWMHVGFMPAPFWAHSVYNTIESKDEKLIVVPRRWTCHEPDAIAKQQKWRLDDGTAEHPPTICPMCIMTSVIARMVTQGEIGFADPVFEWKGADDTVQILAGGIYGHFRKKKGLTRDQQVAMRVAKIRQTDAFKHDMRTGLKYLFAVLDNAHPEKGLQTAVESEGLSGKVRAAIIAEATKVQAQTKIDMRDDRVRGQWDPSRTPYPFLWQYDDTKDFDDKFTVIALRGTEMPPDVQAIIVDGPAPDASDLEPGNCFTLRAELEAHCLFALPWDEIFGPAEKAGLMAPPGESKEEVGDEQGDAPKESVPEMRGGEATANEPVRIGPDHPVWKNKAYKPGPEFKGAELHVLPPDGAKDADVDRVFKVLSAVAKVVAEVVSCEHCEKEMTTIDPSCPSCGAEYDDDGNLTSRPCANAGCSSQVPLEGEAPTDGSNQRYICPSCASFHEVVEEGDVKTWKLVEASPPRAASPRRRRGGGSAGPGAPF